jgi:beta-N-acetylhexosaminidase
MLSRRRLLLGAGLGGIAALAAGCRPGPVASEVPSTRTPTLTPTESPVITAPPATPQPTPSADPAALRRKIGGLLVVGFRGLEVGEDDPVVRAIADDGLGGVVLFDRDQQRNWSALSGRARGTGCSWRSTRKAVGSLA